MKAPVSVVGRERQEVESAECFMHFLSAAPSKEEFRPCVGEPKRRGEGFIVQGFLWLCCPAKSPQSRHGRPPSALLLSGKEKERCKRRLQKKKMGRERKEKVKAPNLIL